MLSEFNVDFRPRFFSFPCSLQIRFFKVSLCIVSFYEGLKRTNSDEEWWGMVGNCGVKNRKETETVIVNLQLIV